MRAMLPKDSKVSDLALRSVYNLVDSSGDASLELVALRGFEPRLGSTTKEASVQDALELPATQGGDASECLNPRVCSVLGCDRDVHVRKHGLCNMHYQQHRASGLIDTKPVGRSYRAPRTWPTHCVVAGCPNGGTLIRGHCAPHYRRLVRYGDPLYVRRKVAGPSPRVPESIKSATDLGRVLGVSRQRAHQLLHREKNSARQIIRQALQTGVIAKPPFCFRCGVEQADLEAHHWDYDRPLDVGWFCPKCHAAVHPHVRGRKTVSA